MGKRIVVRLRWISAGFVAAAWLLYADHADADTLSCDAAPLLSPCFIVDAGADGCGPGTVDLPDGISAYNGLCRGESCCLVAPVDSPPAPDDEEPVPSGEVAFGGSGCNVAGGLVAGGVWFAVVALTALRVYSLSRGTSRSRYRRRQCPD